MEKTIYLAGGCFWGVEAYFRMLKGVISTEVGYANSDIPNPSYEDLKAHRSKASETCLVEYEEKEITLETLLSHYLRFVDPYSIDRQGHDIGHQYRTGIYSKDPIDLETAKAYLDKTLDKPYAIEICPLENFYPAESYHQDYLKKNPGGYCHVDLSLVKDDEKKHI